MGLEVDMVQIPEIPTGENLVCYCWCHVRNQPSEVTACARMAHKNEMIPEYNNVLVFSKVQHGIVCLKYY